jgi:cytosine deaminase
VFASVALPAQPGQSFELVVKDGRIERFQQSPRKTADWMLFAPLADLHVHANRAFTIGSQPAHSLDHAIGMAHVLFRDFHEGDYARHAQRLFAQALLMGTTRLRTHADIHPDTGLKSVRGTLAAAQSFRNVLEVEVVAFASNEDDPVDPRVRRTLREACGLGATLLGAVPAYYADPRASIDALLDLAIELGVRVDLHLDEHLDPARSLSAYLASATKLRALQGCVTLSHGCALAALDRTERARVAESLAESRITVIALPMTNLYLQDRGDGAPLRRGLTPIRELLAAGVELRFASDNVRDAFCPYGAADLLEVAWLIALAAQLDDARALTRGICDGRDEVQAGAEASFVLVRGSSLAQVLAERPGERVVLRRGVRISP